MVEQAKLGADASKYIQEATKALRATEGLVVQLDKLKRTTIAVTKSGDEYTKSLRGMDDAGNKVLVTWREVDKVADKIKVHIEQVARAQAKNTIETKKQTDAQKAQIISQKNATKAARQAASALAASLAKGARPAFGGATLGEKQSFLAARERVLELVRTEKLGGLKINQVIKNVRENRIAQYTKQKRVVQDAVADMVKAERKLGEAVRKVNDARRKAAIRQQESNKRLVKGSKRVSDSVKEVLVSWKSVIRILSAQFIRQVFFAITNQIRESVVAFTELSIKIAEVRTISQDAQLTTEQWQIGLRKLSDSFAIPILDQTEAAYQTLSNQVAKGADVFTFLAEANRFAIAAVTDSSASVNLLTASINAFNLETEDADEVAASFFKTIELGRVRAEEMANSFGRIAIPASQLNVSLDELNAAIATTTIRGIKFSEATTLIRNVLLKLIRPTGEMKKLFAEMGVESGEAAISTFGLSGVLAKIEERTKGSSTELGNLFGRIRAITGAMIFAGQGLEDFNKNLVLIQSSTESYDKAVSIVTDSVGFKFRKQLNKTKNFFINDFGPPLTKVLLGIVNVFGGMDAVAKTLTKTISIMALIAIPALAKSLLALALSNPFTAIAAAIGLVITGIFAVIEAIEGARKAAIEAEIDILNRRTAQLQTQTDREVKLITNAIKEMSRARKIALADNLSALNKEADAIDIVFEKLQDSTKDIAKTMQTELGAGIRSVEKNISDLEKTITGARNNILGLSRSARQELLELDLQDLDLPNKLKLIAREINTLRQQQKISVVALDDKELNRLTSEIDKLFQRQRKLIEKARDTNRKNNKERKEIELEIAQISEDANKKILKLEKERADTPRESKKINEEINEIIGDTRNKIFQLRNEERNLKDEIVPQINLRQQVIDNFEKQKKLRKDLIVLAKEAIEEEKKNLAQLATFKIKLDALVKTTTKFDLDEAIKKGGLAAEQAVLDQIDALESLKKLQDTSIAGAEAKRNIEEEINAISKRAANAREAEASKALARDLDAGEKRVLAAIDNEKELIKLQQARLSRFESEAKRIITGIELPIFVPFEADLTERLRQITEIVKAAPTIENVTKLRNLIEQAKATDPQIDTVIALDELEQSLIKLESILGARESVLQTIDRLWTNIIVAEKQLPSEIKQANDLLQKRKEEARKHAEAELSVNDTLREFIKLQERSLILERQHRRARRERSLSTIAPSEQLSPLAPVTSEFFAHGGSAKGRDTVPAMLSPGEYVINARQSRKFFSQLTAINSGFKPQGFARGGPVTSIGDVNVSMTSSGNESVDAVRLGKAIQREVRRGTLRSFK